MKSRIRLTINQVVVTLWMLTLPAFVFGNLVKDDEEDKIEECDSARTACFAKADIERQKAILDNLAQQKKCILEGHGLDSCQRAFDEAQRKMNEAYTRDTSACREAEKKCKGDTNELNNLNYTYIGETASTKTPEDDSCDVKRKLCEIDADSALAQKTLDAQEKFLECLAYRPGRDGRISCLQDLARTIIRAQAQNQKDKKACLEKYPEKEGGALKIGFDTEKLTFKVFPNPSSGKFTIVPGGNVIEITIMDGRGRIVERRTNVNAPVLRFNLEESGIYSVSVTSIHGEVASKKIIVTE